MCPKKEFSARERYIHIQPKTQETGARKPGTLPGAFEEPQAVGRARAAAGGKLRSSDVSTPGSQIPCKRGKILAAPPPKLTWLS